MTIARKRRVLVAGAKFGEVYLNAFLQDQPGLELAGLLANGSARAQQLAKAFGVPLHTSVEQVPQDIDIACVVVRSAVVGGAGSELAEGLLRRGVHVVQEHPVHPDELARLQTVGERQGCAYWVNSFYPHVAAGRTWIESARRVSARLNGEAPHFAHLATSRQLLYSALDLLMQATDATDAAVELVERRDPAFHLMRVELPGCSALLRLQSYIDPEDPDLHSLAMHQATLGWPSGYLALEASYGPVLWSSALHDPGHRTQDLSLYRLGDAQGGSYLDQAPLVTLQPAPADWRSAFEVEGPAGVGRMLQTLRRHLDGDPAPPAFEPAYQAALARLWRETLQKAGPAEERRLSAPPCIDPRVLPGSAAAAAA